ncbi:MAG: activase [Desulfobacterales bacterium]|nr:activase [Desulfobacterales bacterium]
MKSLGLCLGASTVSVVVLESSPAGEEGRGSLRGQNPRIVDYFLYPHEGNPKKTLVDALERIDMGAIDRVAATGRKFRDFVNLSSIPEPEAVEYAYQFVKPEGVSCPALISAGGETFMVYVLNRAGRVSNVLTGNKCASGTGEFLLQQLRRMDVSLEKAFQWAAADDPHHVSGRCSVFCKSDCTHATNKGVPKSKVTAGLCKMMANKILELLKKVDRRDIMITGGAARNRMMVEYLNQEISGLIVPEEAPYFEALGAALWVLDQSAAPFPGMDKLFKAESGAFDLLPPLRDYENDVEFKTMPGGSAAPGDVCILGLDVGSTTTKAVLMRTSDDAILASIYLRTNGDPVGASRQCYRAILDQVRERVDPGEISITGLGVCGSGRQIAGLHALTDGVINEIIAHSTAAVYFDPEVDTLFEIGGQDAKYTYITNAVPSDYAMNEACSAGTGSFLEESALETLGVEMPDIADVALQGRRPPNFNDQCAAFISSDIKNAIHEGVAHEDIVGGLVYSICMNYTNRVKGSRPVGKKIFMQGGVCYNRAVPLAMASLVGKPIIVPPEPGLMGAFGVALAVKNRIEAGLMVENSFDLETLVNRDVEYGKPFVCKGGAEKCDRRCEVAMIVLEGKKYPFGGACNRYDNLRRKINYNVKRLDLVRVREHLIFEKYAVRPGDRADVEARGRVRGRIGFNRSFLVNTYYPLYSTFFAELGFEPVVPSSSSQEGIDQRNAPFCYPGELAHGFFHSLLGEEPPPEFIFLPHFKAIPLQNGIVGSQVCPLVQGETFYLRATFRQPLDELKKRGVRVLTPLLNLTDGLETAQKPLVEAALKMGVKKRDAKKAFAAAVQQQKRCMAEMKEIGREAIQAVEADPDKIGVVLFARPYNGYVEEAHMGIPRKFASRGVQVIPADFLTYEGEECQENMYWGMGQIMLMAGRVVERHPDLFGAFISNFSCGPDSFIISYFRKIMGRKPSLTLELDNHTADAGLETRIEAFLDIIAAYRQLMAENRIVQEKQTVQPARLTLREAETVVVTSSGETVPLSDPRVTLLTPSMGRLVSEGLAAMFRGRGFNAVSHPPADEAVLKLGRQNTTGKECLPLIITTGSLLNYIRNQKRDDEILVYFMPTGEGPCRFGQYNVFMQDLVTRMGIPDVGFLSLSSETAYAGMGDDLTLLAWWMIVTSDVMEDVRSMILANAVDAPAAMAIFEEEWGRILREIERGDQGLYEKQLTASAERLREIPMKIPPEQVPKVNLTGEIFVRRDSLSRQHLTEWLAERGFAVVCTSIAEWMHYTDLVYEKGICGGPPRGKVWLSYTIRRQVMKRVEKRFKSILSRSGLVHAEPIQVPSIIDAASPYIDINLAGEAVLTVGGALMEVVDQVCGVIAIGPFGCMPNRISEAILREVMNREGRLAADPNNERLKTILADVDDLPFMAIESDGSAFPQLIHAQLEAFCLRASRLHQTIMKYDNVN